MAVLRVKAEEGDQNKTLLLSEIKKGQDTENEKLGIARREKENQAVFYKSEID